MRKILALVLISFVSCTDSKEECTNQKIKLDHLADITKLAGNGYKCDTTFQDFGNSRLKKCRVLFSDTNYKLAIDSYKCHVLFDKKNDLIIAIMRPFASVKIIQSTPISLYILDEKLMPEFSISKFSEKNYQIWKYVYKDGEVHIHKAPDTVEELDVSKLRYEQVVQLVHKIKGGIAYEDKWYSLDEYFYNSPYWTEGIF